MSAGLGWLLATLVTMAVAGSANAAPNASVDLRGVSCTSPDVCVAVGSTNASSTETLAWTLQGGTWQLTSTPGVAGSPFLVDVSCPSGGDCIAVGGAEHGPIAMRLFGGVWTPMPIPAPDRSADLFGVSCPTSHWCMAAGVGAQEKRIASVVLSGGRWRAVAAPAIKGALHFTLNALSCTSRRFCMAVGDTTVVTASRLHGELLTALYDGSSWRVLPMPITFPRTLPSLNGVSCPRTRECIGVGNSNFYSASPGRQLIIRFRAGHCRRWQLMPAPGPSHSRSRARHPVRAWRSVCRNSGHPSSSGSQTAGGRCCPRSRPGRRRCSKTERSSTTPSGRSPAGRRTAASPSAITTVPRSAS
jgi:hypothetical protein